MIRQQIIEHCGRVLQNSLFQMGQYRRNLHLVTNGLWAYPILVINDAGQVRWLHLALAIEHKHGRRRTVIKGLVAKAITNSNNTILLYFEDFIEGSVYPHENWNPQKPRFYPHKSIRKLTYADLEAKERKLLTLYIDAEIQFQEQNTLPTAFVRLFKELIHPVFFYYIKKEAAVFYEALLSGH